jgi:multicomponent Na+:H+ antiporter subunit D
MVIGAAHEKHIDALSYLLLAGGVGTFLSFIKLGYYAFIEGEYDGPVRDANWGQAAGMVLVAGLCVLYGVYPPALYVLLPFPTGAYEYHAYTLGHVEEGLALAAIAAVGFVLLKQPLARVGRVPDVDRLYNPASLYGTRALVVGVTELYAAVDRLVVTGAKTAVDVVRDPGRAAGRLTGDDRVRLRAGFGTSILLVTLVLVGALALLLV